MIAEKVFAEGVAKDIRNYLPPEYEDADFQVVQKNKNNGIQLIGVQVNLPERNASPIIYMEQFFDEIRQGEPVERVMNRIASCIEKSSRAPFMNSGIDLTNYDSLKEHLAIKLVNTQANRKMLQEMPHENIEDLSAICYVDFPVDSGEGKATLEVRNQHLSIWNIDAKKIFQQARSNTQPVNTPILQSMNEIMLSIFNEEGHSTNLLNESVEFGLRSHDMLYALTNAEKQYGASMITQPEVLNKLEQLFPGKADVKIIKGDEKAAQSIALRALIDNWDDSMMDDTYGSVKTPKERTYIYGMTRKNIEQYLNQWYWYGDEAPNDAWYMMLISMAVVCVCAWIFVQIESLGIDKMKIFSQPVEIVLVIVDMMLVVMDNRLNWIVTRKKGLVQFYDILIWLCVFAITYWAAASIGQVFRMGLFYLQK